MAFSITHGPTFTVREPFTSIYLSVTTDHGKVVDIEIDPEAPTIETLRKLAGSGSPILEALFRGHPVMVD